MRAAPGGVPAHLLTPTEIERICVDNLLSIVPEQIYFKDLASCFLRVSKGQADLFGAASPDDLIGKSDFDFFSSQHAQRAYDDEQEIIRTGEALVQVEERQTWPDRPDDWMVSSKYPLRDAQGAIIGTFGISRDITRRVRAELAAREYSAEIIAANVELRRVERELRTLLEGSPDATVKLDRALRHMYVNPRAAQVIGLPVEEIIGRTNRELGLPAGGMEAWEAAIRRVLDGGIPAEHESIHDRGDGRLYIHSRLAPIFGEHGDVTAVLVASRDMTDRHLAEEALAHQAVHDPVTGLANRVLLVDRAAQAIARLERHPGVVAVVFLDLDRFKVVNDSLGHATGNLVLREVARRLTGFASRGDTVARFGGDEFAMLCESLENEEQIGQHAADMAAVLAEPIAIGGHEISLSASIGIATTDEAIGSASDLVRDADAAMYQAKAGGRGRIEFFDAAVHDRASARLELEADMRRALDRGEFHLVYQPLYSLRSRQVTGFEALIRWDHPDRGPLPPAEFIPVAEETRLIVPIDRWVLDEACRQLVSWNAQRPGLTPYTMAVNISSCQLSENDVVEAVTAVLYAHGLDPALLCLEVTETALLQEVALAQRVFEGLSALGVQIALDDFGTGYSSLGHLQRFPVNILKIDRSFVERMQPGNHESAIVAAVTGMARALGLRTVGEGIETEEQMQGLTFLGCDEGQGYLLSRPMPPLQLTSLLGLDAAPEATALP